MSSNAFRGTDYITSLDMNQIKSRRNRSDVLSPAALTLPRWKRFLSYVVEKHGSAKKASVEVEAAVKEYLDRHIIES